MAEQNWSLAAGWKQLLGARSEQQDGCGISSLEAYSARGCLAVLADGMGGMEHGAAFSRAAVEGMLECFAAAAPQEDACGTLLAAYLHARQQALAMRRQGMEGGSTVAAALVRDGRCCFLSAGDSRIYLLRNGKLLQLNREQTLGVILDERASLGLIAEEEARNNTRRGALLNNIAQDPPHLTDRNLTPLQLLSGDRLLLLSDGVFRSVEDERLRALAGGPLDRVLDDVLRAVTERGDPRQDNSSIVMLCCVPASGSGEGVAG